MAKKIILPILLTITTISLLTACGQSPAAPAPQPEENAAQQTSPGKDIVLDLGDKIPYYTGNIISVKSQETVNIVPDIAQIVYAVRTEGNTASDCQKQNSEAVSSVIAQFL